jgi:hypothetical protein
MNIETVRAAVKSLSGRSVVPKDGNFIGYSLPELRDGIVWFGIGAAMHPAAFLDMFGVRRFRKLKRDVSKSCIEDFIAQWKKRKI